MKSEEHIARFLEARGFRKNDLPYGIYARDDPVYGNVFYSQGVFRWVPYQPCRFGIFLFEARKGVEEAYGRLEEGIRTVYDEGYSPTPDDKRRLREKGFMEKTPLVWCRDAETISFNGGWRIECPQSLGEYFHVRLEDALLALEGA